MRSKIVLKLVSGVVVFFFVATLVVAQADRATLTGTVLDSSGAPVAGATVTATNVNTRIATQSVTNNLGLYRIPDLPVGQYSIAYEKSGFQKLVRDGVGLGIAQVAEVNVT